MILVLCPSYPELLHTATNVAQNKILHLGHRAKWIRCSGVMEDLSTGERWHFVNTDHPENIRRICGQVYTDCEGDLPPEWHDAVLSRVRAL